VTLFGDFFIRSNCHENADDLTISTAMLILIHMDPSRRIARDLKACLVVGPILLLMWVLKGCG